MLVQSSHRRRECSLMEIRWSDKGRLLCSKISFCISLNVMLVSESFQDDSPESSNRVELTKRSGMCYPSRFFRLASSAAACVHGSLCLKWFVCCRTDHQPRCVQQQQLHLVPGTARMCSQVQGQGQQRRQRLHRTGREPYELPLLLRKNHVACI